MKFTGYFNNTDLDQAMELICLPLNLTYAKSQDGTLVVTKE